MKKVSVSWSGDRCFDGVDSKGMPVDIDGHQKLGAKPSELLPIALCACSAVDVVEELRKSKGELLGLYVEALFTQAIRHPWPFQRIHLHYVITGKNISVDEVDEAIRLSLEERCSVAATIRASVKLESSFELRHPEDNTAELPG